VDITQLQKATKSLQILYVEDSLVIRKATHKMLLNYFEIVDVAKDGAEAFELYVTHYDNMQSFYDIVITDLEMPHMDGKELSMKIMDYNYTQEIIVISSVGEFARLVDLMNLGVKKFISKPIEEQQLSEVIEQVYNDITLKKLQESEMQDVKEYNERLKVKEQEQKKVIEDKVIELQRYSDALENSLTELRKQKKAKEDFFINISHEMKTPLNSILGFSAMLKKRLADDEKSLLMASTIYETGNDLNKLIESIIDLRKIQDHTLELVEVAFHPHDEITKCINSYVKDSFAKNQKYETFIESELPQTLLGDPKRITQVIGIVIENAIKFTDDEGSIGVSVEYDASSECLVCQVKDSGIGIAKEQQSEIFNIEQLDAQANRAHEGAGLGLNIASNLMKIMKGKIQLKSVPSKGSVFKLEFPLKKI